MIRRREAVADSEARSTLEKARYFLGRAVAAEADYTSLRIAYTANLEAAIIYGHAVWDHLRAEFGRHQQYKTWCEKHLSELRVKPLFQFISFAGKRDQSENLGYVTFLFIAAACALTSPLRRTSSQALP
jgi:hypothetical protein